MKKVIALLTVLLFVFGLSACGLFEKAPECATNQELVDGTCVDIVIEDPIDPIIYGASDKTINAGDTIDLLDGVTAIDETDGDITASIVVTGTVETNTPGTYTIVYYVEDLSGNSEEVTITVTVVESGAVGGPTVSAIANSNFSELSSVTDEFVELQGTLAVSDVAVDGDSSISLTLPGTSWGGIYVIMTDPVDVSIYNAVSISAQIPDSVTELTFKLEDGTNNATVNLLDYADSTSGDWTTYVIPMAAFSNLDFTNFKVIGFWNAKDVDGNYAAVTMLFDNFRFFDNSGSVDTTSPVISGAVDATYYLNETVDLTAGVTAVDNIDGNITANINIDGTVDTTTLGVYTITYSVSDAAGNYTEVEIDITIAEAPAAITLGEMVNSDFTELNAVTDVFNGLQATIGLSTTAYDGSNSLSLVFPGGNWGGTYVSMETPVDLSMYNTLTLVAQVPASVAILSIKLEDGTSNASVNLMDYATGTDGAWTTFTIPTSVFTNVNLATFKVIGFWNAKDVDSNYVAATILIDNLKFSSVAWASTLFSTTTTVFDATSGSFAALNSATVGITTDALDGGTAIQMDFNGLDWGGIYTILTDGVDVSGYTNLVFSIKVDTAVTSLVVKVEDGTNNYSINISNYTAVVDGEWLTYTIPLADFVGVDFTNFKVLGFWHPKDVNGSYIACEMIFDNLYFN